MLHIRCPSLPFRRHSKKFPNLFTNRLRRRHCKLLWSSAFDTSLNLNRDRLDTNDTKKINEAVIGSGDSVALGPIEELNVFSVLRDCEGGFNLLGIGSGGEIEEAVVERLRINADQGGTAGSAGS